MAVGAAAPGGRGQRATGGCSAARTAAPTGDLATPCGGRGALCPTTLRVYRSHLFRWSWRPLPCLRAAVLQVDACLQDATTSALLQRMLSGQLSIPIAEQQTVARQQPLAARQTLFVSATLPQRQHFRKQCVQQRWCAHAPMHACISTHGPAHVLLLGACHCPGVIDWPQVPRDADADPCRADANPARHAASWLGAVRTSEAPRCAASFAAPSRASFTSGHHLR